LRQGSLEKVHITCTEAASISTPVYMVMIDCWRSLNVTSTRSFATFQNHSFAFA
jgi:hypothetical protein